jgi:acetate kinase
MGDTILVVNAGSSSLKFSAFAPTGSSDPALMLRGQIEGIGTRPRLLARDAQGAVLAERSFDPTQLRDHGGAIGAVSAWLRDRGGGRGRLIAVGHRVVHGGAEFAAPVLIDDAVLERLEALVQLAPLHQPANLAGIRAVRRAFPTLPQVACFDTAFHHGHPEVADRFALPETLYQEGVRRYGFHGLSYEYIVSRLPVVAPDIAVGRVVVAHLGSGASMCAVKAGRSIDSTMGFTALDGLPMGTRCGALDPGAVIYLIRDKGLPAEEVERLLYHDCGLRGLSGLSNDVRDLLASKEPAAALALDYFVYHVSRQLGALAAVLEGVDAVVFTAGIGEHSPELRARICRRAAWLGLRLDEAANRAGGPRITAPDSKVAGWVIPTDEEMVIARHTLALIHPAEAATARGPSPA